MKFTEPEEFIKSASCAAVKEAAGNLLARAVEAIAAHPGATMATLGSLGIGAGVASRLLGTQPSQQMPTADALGFADKAVPSLGRGIVLELFKGIGGSVGKEVINAIRSAAHGIARASRPEPFDALRRSDPVIAQADAKSLRDAYETMQRFAPTLATDKNAVRAWLREAAVSGGGVNYNTIKLLTDAEIAAREGGVW